MLSVAVNTAVGCQDQFATAGVDGAVKIWQCTAIDIATSMDTAEVNELM